MNEKERIPSPPCFICGVTCAPSRSPSCHFRHHLISILYSQPFSFCLFHNPSFSAINLHSLLHPSISSIQSGILPVLASPHAPRFPSLLVPRPVTAATPSPPLPPPPLSSSSLPPAPPLSPHPDPSTKSQPTLQPPLNPHPILLTPSPQQGLPWSKAPPPTRLLMLPQPLKSPRCLQSLLLQKLFILQLTRSLSLHHCTLPLLRTPPPNSPPSCPPPPPQLPRTTPSLYPHLWLIRPPSPLLPPSALHHPNPPLSLRLPGLPLPGPSPSLRHFPESSSQAQEKVSPSRLAGWLAGRAARCMPSANRFHVCVCVMCV